MTHALFANGPAIIAALHLPQPEEGRSLSWLEDYAIANSRVFAAAGRPWVKVRDQTRADRPSASHTIATMTAFGPRHALARQAEAHRARIGRTDIALPADVHDRTSVPLSGETQPVAAGWADKAGADGLVITGNSFDDTLARTEAVRAAGVRLLILVGGGVTTENFGTALDATQGVVVGSALMRGGADDLVRWDADACAGFMDVARAYPGMTERDFVDYRDGTPDVRWPGGAGLAVSIVVNIEEGAELSLGDGDESNESIYEAVERVDGMCDLCMESHFEHGPRAAWPRIRAALRSRRLAATLNACGRALERSPWIASEPFPDGQEVAAHRWRWERHVHMSEPQERSAIARTVAAISRTAGTQPMGRHTRSAISERTRDLLIEQGGFLYDSNASTDDVPYVVETSAGPHVVLPYAFDTNDMRFFNRGGFVSGADFWSYCIDAFDRLHHEAAQASRMLSVGLHPRMIGRPARNGGLEAFLDHALSRGDVWFATRAQIATHWRAAVGLPAREPRTIPPGFGA